MTAGLIPPSNLDRLRPSKLRAALTSLPAGVPNVQVLSDTTHHGAFSSSTFTQTPETL